MWEYIFWAVVFVIALVAEAVTVALVSIWMTVGAVAAFIVSVAGGSFSLQCTVFVLVSLILLAVSRPLAKRLSFIGKKPEATNADSVIGMEGVVRQAIEGLSPGRVCVNGLDWSAKAVSEDAIPIGARVIVEKIEGVTLLVRPLETVTESA